MKKAIVGLLVGWGCVAGARAQREMTDAEYGRQDSALWTGYEKRLTELAEQCGKRPEKADSLRAEQQAALRTAVAGHAALALRFANTPSGLHDLYRVRGEVAKDSLRSALKRLDAERSKSFHARLLREYVRTKQVGEGDKLVPFPCQTADGRPFDWKTTWGKAVLLLYGGLDCMGPQGREALQALYDAASCDEWLVIVYQKVSAPEQMQPLKQRFRDAYIYVTDGKEEASPMCIRYGA